MKKKIIFFATSLLLLVNIAVMSRAFAISKEDIAPMSTDCKYQTMGYCSSTLTYKCVNRKTAVYCYKYACYDCLQAPGAEQ